MPPDAVPTLTAPTSPAPTPTVPPNAGSPSPTPTPTPSPTPEPTGDWTKSISDEAIKHYVTEKGFKNPSELATAYQNLEKLIGVKDKLVTLPDSADDKDGWSKIYDKLGRPEKPEGYEFKMPTEHADEKFAGWAREKFHELGFTKGQGEKLVTAWNEYVSTGLQEMTQNQQIKVQEESEGLKQEWGEAYNLHLGRAKVAAAALNVDEQTLDALQGQLGYKGTMKLFHNISAKMMEADLTPSDGVPGFNAMTPQAAQQKIAELKKDKSFVEKWSSGDNDAKKKMNDLHKMAYPEVKSA